MPEIGERVAAGQDERAVPQSDEIAAAIDIGSNTVHMLVGRYRDGRIEQLDDASELVGLAVDVYGGGAISSERLAAAVEALETLTQRARDRGATSIALVATAAVRDAANADELVAAVRQRTGLELQLIGGDREAALTYRGASAGEEASSLQVCDVGGGSTEVIRAEGGVVTLQTSLPLGSSRLSRLCPSDPPTASEVARAYDEARRVLDAVPRWRPVRLIVTGGTATALTRLAGALPGHYAMPAAQLDDLRNLLTRQPSSEIAAAHEIEPKRARLLPAGAAIIAALRDTTGVESVLLTPAGLRHGLLIEYFEGRR